jgi:HAE1 family hydrophobic/amphiphilic exporter-1/multidrug efflux pump
VEEGMSPIEAAIKGLTKYSFAVISISITLAAVFLPVIFLEGFGTSVSGICVVIGAAVLISAFVSLTLTPMLNAYLMKGGEQKKSKFYVLTEPYFQKLNSSYAEALSRFMDKKWLSLPILIACFWIDICLIICPKETAPYDDRSSLILRMTALKVRVMNIQTVLCRKYPN